MVTALSLAIGLVGLTAAIYFGLDNRKVRSRISRFTWYDVESGVKHLAKEIESGFKPDIIVCSSAGSVGIVSNLYLTYTKRFVPLYMGVSKAKAAAFTSTPAFDRAYETDKWETFLPDLTTVAAERVLILEDVVITGSTMNRIKEILISAGFQDDQIRTAALFVTNVARQQNADPDYSWKFVGDSLFELPWGGSFGKSV